MGDNKNLTVTKAGGAGEKDTNPTHYVTQTYWDERVYQRPTELPVMDWRILAVRYAGAGCLALLSAGAYSLWHLIHCWDGANYIECLSYDYWVPRAVAGVAFIGFTLWAIERGLKIKNNALGHRGEALRMQFERDRFGNLVPLTLYDKLDDSTLLNVMLSQYSASTNLKALTAPYEKYNGINNLSEGNTSNVSSSVDVGKEEIAEGEVLPEIVPVEQWLPWLTDKMVPHLLLTGKTRSGKSTLADIILKFRADRGDTIAILDPHWSTQDQHGNRKWGGIRPLAKNIDEIVSSLRAIKAEYDDRKRRMQLPSDHPDFTAEMCFDPITVLIDEVPEIVTELSSDKSLKGLWNETVKLFGSGGAKVNINVILLSQSPNIEDVGMNGKMRENFCIIALPTLTRTFIEKYELDRQKKETLLSLLSTNSGTKLKPFELPAAAEFGGVIHVLSRDGILNHRVTAINAAVWKPSEQTVWTEKLLSDEKQHFISRPDQTDAQTKLRKAFETEAGRMLVLQAMRRKGFKRDEAREKLRQLGLGINNDEWARAA